MARFDSMGREIPDPTPVEFNPVFSVRPEPLAMLMRRLIREEFSQAAEAAGAESFEEANDFEVEDDDWDDRLTAYEEMGHDFGQNDADEVGGTNSPGEPGEPTGSVGDPVGNTAGAVDASSGNRPDPGNGKPGVNDPAKGRENPGTSRAANNGAPG